MQPNPSFTRGYITHLPLPWSSSFFPSQAPQRLSKKYSILLIRTARSRDSRTHGHRHPQLPRQRITRTSTSSAVHITRVRSPSIPTTSPVHSAFWKRPKWKPLWKWETRNRRRHGNSLSKSKSVFVSYSGSLFFVSVHKTACWHSLPQLRGIMLYFRVYV